MNIKKILLSVVVLAYVGSNNTVVCSTTQHGQDEPITVYSHGYLCNKFFSKLLHASSEYGNKFCANAFITGPMKSFNYSDCLIPILTYFGQDGDVERLHHACKDHKKVILVGVSRGASTIINYLGLCKPNNIIAAVLESPYDHTEKIGDYFLDVIFKSIMSEYGKNKFKKFLQLFFVNYKHNGIQPICLTAHIPHTIPLLFISSEHDGIIPSWSTKNLYDALREAGHQNAYLLSCQHGAHGRIIWGKDGKKFRNIVHAFYRHHKIPHQDSWAAEGQSQFLSILT
ncbi:MAG: hypothetical protein NTX86_01645 [Candidatus Dependentiae bacterium]|nr:hypothetical protein [Candidatus Dependentiae bacterium]